MPSSSPSPPPSPPSPPSLPLPLTASLHLTSLPPDASLALSLANNAQTSHPNTTNPNTNPNTTSSTSASNNNSNDTNIIPDKITIRFQAVGSAPQLTQKTFKVSSKNRFDSVVGFLGRKLAKAKPGEGGGGGNGVFCYVNSVFAPGLDEGVGGLWRCFKTDDQLIVAYSMTPAFG